MHVFSWNFHGTKHSYWYPFSIPWLRASWVSKGDRMCTTGLNIPAPESLFRYHDPGRCGYQKVEPKGIRRIVYTRRIPSGTRTSSARARLARAQVQSAFHLLRNALQSGGKSAGSLGISWMTFFCNAATDGASARDESRVAETTGWNFKVFLSFSSSV